MTEIELPKGAGPAEIVGGSDGNLWFAEDKANRIARVTASGNVKEFAILTPDSRPAMMVLGPDGNVWFTQPQARKIGSITAGGYITEFAMPAAGVPLGIAAGVDKNLWVTVINSHVIYRVTPKGVFTAFPMPQSRWRLSSRLLQTAPCGSPSPTAKWGVSRLTAT